MTLRKPSPKIRYESGCWNLSSQAGLNPMIKFLDALGQQIHERKSCQPSADQQILLRALGLEWLPDKDGPGAG